MADEARFMMSTAGTVFDADYYSKYGDPRMEPWLFMDSPAYAVVGSALYLLFIKVIGPAWMRGRTAYDLKHAMLIYNVLMVAMSGWMAYNYIAGYWFKSYSWRCEPIDFSDKKEAVKMAEVCWVFFLSKLIEFADTIFFILRKKESQITALHVLHHSITPITAWYGVKFGPGGYNTIFPMSNTFVHTWMYLYYGLAGMGPAVRKFLWWKKYITSLQLMQFVLVFFYFLHLHLFPVEGCGVTQFLIWLSLIQAVFYFALFLHFYVTTYSNSQKAAKNGLRRAPHQE